MSEREETRELLQEFLEEHGIEKVISFSGGSDSQKDAVEATVKEAIEGLALYKVAILTGGTKWGVPGIASSFAHDYKLPTIGVFPERGEKDSERYNVDYMIIARTRYGQSEFGDESELFAKLPDGMVFLGGGYGTLVEFAHVLKLTERRVKPKYNERAPVIVPIFGFGGTTDIIDTLAELAPTSNVRSLMPQERITSGVGAVNYLINSLDLNHCRKGS